MQPPRTGLTARWTLPEALEPTPQPLLERVLNARGLKTEAQREAYLNGKLEDFPPCEALPGCKKAAQRLLKALKDKTPITIYGDFDVDGITATAILWHTLRAIAPDADVQWYIPRRLDEGYGLNTDALDALAAAGRQLIITVDCGATATKEAAHAADIGLELIITDHHTLHADDPLPHATAIVHPGLPDTPYGFPSLAGAGVAWKLACMTTQLYQGTPAETQRIRWVLFDCLTLAAMGTVADVMPLINENRNLVSWGLKYIQGISVTAPDGKDAFHKCSIQGVQALVKACTKPGERVSAETVGFRIGPRLNAAGRLGHAAEAVELLTSATGTDADTLAHSLTRQNEVRRKMVGELFDEADQAAQSAGMTGSDRRIIVLTGDTEHWHRGVLGIACSRLVEKYQRPVILLQCSGDLCGGSSRSVPGLSMYNALQHCNDLLQTWGGHHMAAGLSLHADKLEPFVERITDWVNEHLSQDELLAHIVIDGIAQQGDLIIPTIKTLDAMHPIGRGNEHPCLLVQDAVVRSAKVMGKAGDHLDLTLETADGLISAVWWRGAGYIDDLVAGVHVDVAAQPIVDTWREPRARLVIQDVAPVQG